MFTQEEKIKIWIDYMVTIVALNNMLYEYTLTGKLDDSYKKYPILGVATSHIFSKHKVKSFDDFCDDLNELKSDSLNGWYWRFKDRIFK